MKLVFALILGLSFSINAAAEEMNEVGPLAKEQDASATEAGTGDCDLTKMQIALAEKAPTHRQHGEGKEKGMTAQLKLVDPNDKDMIVASVSNDPFGSPCRFR